MGIAAGNRPILSFVAIIALFFFLDSQDAANVATANLRPLINAHEKSFGNC